MPRRSKLDVAMNLRPVLPGDRPAPPDYLRDDAKEEWRRVIDRMPPRWFTAVELGVLEQRCWTICCCREIAAEIDNIKTSNAEDPRLDRLISRYARLAPLTVRQSRYLKLPAENQRPPVAVARTRGATLDVVPPWEDDGADDD